MMINPPKPPEGPKPTKALFKSLYQELTDQAKDIPTKPNTEQIPLNVTVRMASLSDDNLSMCMNNSATLSKVGPANMSVNFVTNM